MPQIIIVAGPNGAGKTTFAREFLAISPDDFAYVNADEIAWELAASGVPASKRDMLAGRTMLQGLEKPASGGEDFMFETTLASLTYVRKIAKWRNNGYRITLLYLRLANPDLALERVRRRVAAGGHSIPESVVRQRFDKSARYFERYYNRAVDEWYVWDSLEKSYRLAETWES